MLTQKIQKISQIILAVFLGAAIIYIGGDYLWKKYKISSFGKTINQSDAIVYLPNTLKKGEHYPLIVSFSPAGNADVMIELWQPLADKHQLIIYASKIYRNGAQMDLPTIKNYIDQAVSTFSADKNKIIYTGLSGGGSFSHFMNLVYPGFAYGVIINTGKFWELDQQPQQKMRQFGSARNKIAFIASPTDFRYQEMQRDYSWMKQWGFAVNWIEFQGGHRYAPQEAYDQTLDWMLSKKSDIVIPTSNPNPKLRETNLLKLNPQPQQQNNNMQPYSYQ